MSSVKKYLIGPLLLITLVAGVPYQLFFDGSRGAGNNTLTLRCKNITDGNPVPGALFYRNSRLNTSDSTCFKNSSSLPDHELQFTLTPDCDGYFSCGKEFSNGREILSGPRAAYAYPRTNDSARTVVTEIGKSVLLTCDFIPSPINTYATTWYRRGLDLGISPIPLATMPQLASYLLSDLQSSDEDIYYCLIIPSERNAGQAHYTGPNITLQLIERYEAPSITRDLNYSRSADGYDVFSVSTSGTNLTHEWYINGTIVNHTQSAVDGVTVAGVSADSLSIELTKCGSLNVTYVISNMDYAGLNHSARQTFGFYNVCTSSDENMVYYGWVTCAAISGGIGMFLLVVILVLIIIICVILCLRKSACLKPSTKVEPAERTDSNIFTTSDVQSLDRFTAKMATILVNVFNHEKIDPKVHNEIWELLIKFGEHNTGKRPVATDHCLDERQVVDSINVPSPTHHDLESPCIRHPPAEKLQLSAEDNKVIELLKNHLNGTFKVLKEHYLQ